MCVRLARFCSVVILPIAACLMGIGLRPYIQRLLPSSNDNQDTSATMKELHESLQHISPFCPFKFRALP